MSEREYADLIRRMRDAQREYFKYRNEGAKMRAIGLEREVDAETARRLSPPPPRTLFDAIPDPGDTL